METESNFDFDTFLAEVSVVYIGYFSNQTEFDEVYWLSLTSSLFYIHTLFKTMLHAYVCKLLEFTIQGMSFKTRFTSMVDTRGMSDSVSLRNIKHNDRNSGEHNWHKTFWAVYLL